MKIGIITIQKCNNYGADLQAFALQRKLRMLGYDAENIDYLFYKDPDFVKTPKSRPIVRLSLVNRLKEWLLPKLKRLIANKSQGCSQKRSQAFKSFFENNVRVSREYNTIDALYANPPDYDVYITGSDQVWNPRMGCNIKPYFLDFVASGKRCIAYAASIGVPVVSPVVYGEYRKLLKRYCAIGVREESAKRIIAGMGLGVPVATVVDPTLLLSRDEWLEVAAQPAGVEKKQFVVEYNLGNNKLVHALAKRAAKSFSVPLVVLTGSEYGPAEFLWLMANAKAAIVSSFHGTIFSVLNKVPFYSTYGYSADSNGGRIAAFAQSLGLGTRMIQTSEIENLQLDFEVDFDRPYKLLNAMRERSIKFLVDAIQNPIHRDSAPANPLCYALWSKNEEIRSASTSGGAFYHLAERILAKGGVVFGAEFEQNFRHVRHRAARSLEELTPLMKSKYVYSECTGALKEAYIELKAGRTVLFAGTPCQISAVKALCKSYGDKLITVDIVCHGTPKEEVFESYVNELENQFNDTITNYEFRNKKYGWNFGSILIEFKSGKTVRRHAGSDPYFSGFARNIFLRECCYACPYAKLERVSDITIADCWRVAASHPHYDDGKGTSLILVNTPKGKRLFDLVCESGECNCGDYDVELARMRNTPLMFPPVRGTAYNAFKREFERTGSLHTAAKTYFSTYTMIQAMVRYWVKRLGWFYFKRHQ